MYRTLKIEGFRAFESLTMEGLGRVNLIVGKNNCGKTSVLEAIEILASSGEQQALLSPLLRRGEHVQEHFEGRRRVLPEARRLFHHFAIAAGVNFRIEGNTDNITETVTVRFTEGEGQRYFGDSMTLNAPLFLQASWDAPVETSRRLTVSSQGGLVTENAFRRPKENPSKTQFIPTASLTSSEVVSLFNEVVLTPEEDWIVDALQTIEPSIERIASIGADNLVHGRQAGIRTGIALKCKGVSERIPIGSMGDGSWRILGIALGLAQSSGGILLVDEIDSGLHYSAMHSMWKLVMQTATRLGAQVFATTHNSDCWRSLAAVTKSEGLTEDDVSIQRIENRRPKTVPFSWNEMIIAAEDDIEVR